MRKSGIILHISSLPSEYGIGTMGKEAYEFIDFLKESGIKIWQVLPIGQTGFGDSPYQSFSTFAGNPYFIDYARLIEMGLLEESDLPTHEFPTDTIDFGAQYIEKYAILRKSFDKGYNKIKAEVEAFKEAEPWVVDYGLFMALKDYFGGRSWQEWADVSIKNREPYAIGKYQLILRNDINFYCYIQCIFYKEWLKLKNYANENGIEIFGDIPIYCSMDSCDVWANTDSFQLDGELKPSEVAGVPPDYFSEDGQLWGNPLYNWEKQKENNYEFWVNRMKGTVKLFDMIRLDHFIGFANYYAVPANSENARIGQWKDGPDSQLFDVIEEKIANIKIVAEDLGIVSEKVINLREKYNYPGMSILMFMFDPKEDTNIEPNEISKNTIVYTGTHDNDTLTGWWSEQDQNLKDYVLKYLSAENDDNIVYDMIEKCLMSNADTAIIPMQDYLIQDTTCRLNTPGTQGDNWKYRVRKEDITSDLATKIRELNVKSDRI